MAENNFEKQVGESMDNFGLSPAPAVWEAVEHRIRKERKRKFFFWLFFFTLATGVGLSFFFRPGYRQAHSLQTIPVSDNKIHLNETGNTDNKLPKINEPDDKTATVPSTTSPRQEPAFNQNTGIVSKKFRPSNRIGARPGTLQPAAVAAAKLLAKKPAATLAEEELKTKTQHEIPANTTSKSPALSNIPVENNSGNKNQAVSVKAVPDTAAGKMAAGERLPKAGQKASWHLEVSIGRSAISRGLQLFGGKMDAMSLPSSTPFAGATVSTALHPYFSFSAGIFRKTAISRRLNLDAGLHYRYLSTRVHAGKRIDSSSLINNFYSNNLAVNRYYRPSSTGDGNSYYTNQYHFISLSLDLSWSLVRGVKFKASWNNGLSYDRLLGSNMLHYDNASRVFYKDNNRLRKDQLFYHTALEFPLTKKISVNPFASFGITRVFKFTDTAYHYTNYGIQLRLQLGNKKRNLQR